MKEKRYFIDAQMRAGECVTLSGDEFHHMSGVMRAKIHDRACLFNGNGNFYFGEIINMQKKSAVIKIDKMEASTNEPRLEFHLFQALAKGDKLSLVTQKITELGAAKLFLFESKFTDAKPSENKPERLKLITISAAKQCGRASLVEIEPKVLKISDISNLIPNYEAFFVAYENADCKTLTDELLSIKNGLSATGRGHKIAIMIGAEGGFSLDEVEALEAAGARVVSLGERILRTETAAIATTALVMGILENSAATATAARNLDNLDSLTANDAGNYNNTDAGNLENFKTATTNDAGNSEKLEEAAATSPTEVST